MAVPTREEYEEGDPLNGEGRDEADPVVPAGMLPHHLEKIPDAVVSALSPALIGVCRAVMDKRGRDHEGAEPGSTGAQREVDILAIGEQARIECPHRVDHSRVDQHGATCRVVHVGRWTVGLDPPAPAGMPWPATPRREFAAAVPDLVGRLLEGDLRRKNPCPGCAPGNRDEGLEAATADYCVVVQKEDIVYCRVQGDPDSPVAPFRKAEVARRAEDLD